MEGSSAPVIGFALRGLSGPTCTSHQGTCYRDGDDLSSLDTSCMEHPKNMDNSQYSGSKEGEDQGSKEVVEEKKGVSSCGGSESGEGGGGGFSIRGLTPSS